ncbi:MAG: hypothetical protein HQM08_16100 [Candidatus Riflebacteria bacterium]|nr:hypothetical protein [Candidatus Riflebacteria bacterium]
MKQTINRISKYNSFHIMGSVKKSINHFPDGFSSAQQPGTQSFFGYFVKICGTKNFFHFFTLFAFQLFSVALFAGGSFPVPHTPQPDGHCIINQDPDSNPFTYRSWCKVDAKTNLNLAGEFDTASNTARNTPFIPGIRDGRPVMYFGPNKIGNSQLLSGAGLRLTPSNQVWTNYDLASRLDYWYWQNHYTWRNVNYWYSVPIAWTTYCWSGGCSGTGDSTYCWPGGCVTYASDFNNYEVYYWTTGDFLYKLKSFLFSDFPIEMKKHEWNPGIERYIDADSSFSGMTTGQFTRLTPIGLKDFDLKYHGKIDAVNFQYGGYSFNNPEQNYDFNFHPLVHPLPAINPTWRMDYDNVWHPEYSETVIKLKFSWTKDSLNRNDEQYYIEYCKIFDGKIKMRDIVKLLSNLGYGQIDVPVYMALESDEPKLYLVTTPTLVNGARKAPYPYTPITNADGSLLDVSGVIPGFTLHPTTQSYARGYIRECKTPLTFTNGKPEAGPVKYVFTKMFDFNCDDKIDDLDKAFFQWGLISADFNEDGNITAEDCAGIWEHSFNNFPRAFEKLGDEIRTAIAANPDLLKIATVTATVAPVPIVEAAAGGVARSQIGWEGNAFHGNFYVSPVPGQPSKLFPFIPAALTYDSKTDPGITGAKFLPNLGPAPFPSSINDEPAFPQLFGHCTNEIPDGTILGKLKRLTIKTYPKCDFTKTGAYPVGDPWRLGLLESVESGWMGSLFIFGDVDGKNGFNSADFARWDEIKALDGFLLNSVWQHRAGVAPGAPVVTDLNKEFRVIASGKFSAYPPKGVNYFEVKESYNYSYFDPTIWAYDPADGNEFSVARMFNYDSGWSPPVTPPKPPYPPIETRLLPTQIIGPNEVPEDIVQTWKAPGTEEVIIKPGTWSQTWKIVSIDGVSGTGDTFTYKILEAGQYTIFSIVTYVQRIVTPVTDGLGIIVYYAVTDVPMTRTVSLNVRVQDHIPSDFDDPKLKVTGSGNSATYAPQWGSSASALQMRDFPSKFRAFPETRETDVRMPGAPFLSDNDWLPYSTSSTLNELHDQHFDIVNADLVKKYDYPVNLELKFARRVKEANDLNTANMLGQDDLECYSGVLLDSPVKLALEIKQKTFSGSENTWKNFEFTPDTSSQGSTMINLSDMSEYLVKSGSRYLTVKTVQFPTKFSWEMPIPTFPNEYYEMIFTLTYTQRDFYVDHPSQETANRTKFGADYSRLAITGDGVCKFLDRPKTIVWKRRAFTVDVTPPQITSFEQTNGDGVMTAIDSDGGIHATTGDQLKYRLTVSDNHPGYGPNDGLKNGGTRRAWYPRYWIQSIDGLNNKFSLTATSGYELPLILPSVKNILRTDQDGDLAANVTSITAPRVDGHYMAVVEPTNIEDLGTLNCPGMTIRHQFSNYIAGKIAYVIEIEDSSRNFTRYEGVFKVVDNKRPNIDLRLATPKYKPLPDDGTLAAISQILTETPLGPKVSPFGALAWASTSSFATVVSDRTKASKPGLLTNWIHPYNTPDQSFTTAGFLNNFQTSGYFYHRELSLDEPINNRPITLGNTSKFDDPLIKLADSDVKAAFNLANPTAPGFAEDEVLTFDLSIRDNVLFWQNDSLAPQGMPVPEHNFKEISYEFLEDVIDQKKVNYHSQVASTPVSTMNDVAPLRLLNTDGTVLSHVFRVGNASNITGLKNSGAGPNVGSNTFYLKAVDLGDNTRELLIDLPIIPSHFVIRVLETNTTGERH